MSHLTCVQGAAHPAKVVIQRQHFEEVGRRTGKGFDEIIGKRGWIARPPLDFLCCEGRDWEGWVGLNMDECDFDAMRDASLLKFMLGSEFNDVDDAVDELFFDTFPIELDATGVNGNPLEKIYAEDIDPYDPKMFRDLPDNGRRSPRSTLFCSLSERSGTLPAVRKLEMSQAFQEHFDIFEREGEGSPCPFFDDEPLSDAQEAESLSEMLELVGDDYHDVKTGRPKASYGQMCDMLRDQGAAGALRELYQVEETNVVNSYADKICWDPSVLEQLRATIARHFAAGESSNSAALHEAISNIEDKYLAEEEEDEAASDLSCSQQRLALEIERFVRRLHS